MTAAQHRTGLPAPVRLPACLGRRRDGGAAGWPCRHSRRRRTGHCSDTGHCPIAHASSGGERPNDASRSAGTGSRGRNSTAEAAVARRNKMACQAGTAEGAAARGSPRTAGAAVARHGVRHRAHHKRVAVCLAHAGAPVLVAEAVDVGRARAACAGAAAGQRRCSPRALCWILLSGAESAHPSRLDV
jgi:phenylpropionate dioxygenase-like ring-hydroxylating dioxygenase large terminal subunit